MTRSPLLATRKEKSKNKKQKQMKSQGTTAYASLHVDSTQRLITSSDVMKFIASCRDACVS
jgi:hypothetical protein